MSPLFAQYVDPVFMRVFDLLERIDAGLAPSPEKECRIINFQLSQAERQLRNYGLRAEATGKGEDWSPWKLSKYALVAWIDEVLLNSESWPGRTWWQQNLLEWEHFKKAESNEHFYERANEAASRYDGGDASDDALETYYVCFMLGFRGLYRQQQRDSETFELSIRKYGLPSSMESWANGMADVIKERRKNRVIAAADHARERSIATAKPLWGLVRPFWLPWLVALLLFGLCVVCFYYQP